MGVVMDWNDIIIGKLADERQRQNRSDFERDHDRIIFSSAFRQLNQKTQVFPMPENYFVHNRMTHSLETSCIGRSIGKIVGEELIKIRAFQEQAVFPGNISAIIEAACLAHDIGNPPFGHSGEDAISDFFINNPSLLADFTEKEKQDLCNFEGNAQGFRLLTKKNTDLEITHNVLIAFIKYPRESSINAYIHEASKSRKDQKKYSVFQNEKLLFRQVADFFNLSRLAQEPDMAYARHPLAYLVEAADDICYLIVDIEDGVRLGIVPVQEIQNILEPLIFRDAKANKFKEEYHKLDANEKMGYLRAKAINCLVNEVVQVFIENLAPIENGSFASTLIQCVPSKAIVQTLKEKEKKELYSYPPVLEIEAAGFDIINGFLELIMEIKTAPANKRNKKIARLFPENVTNQDLTYSSILHVTDYISGMTDSFAINLYNKIKGVKLPKLY